MSLSALKAQINTNLDNIFRAFADGMDVAPAQLFHTEGLLQAAILIGKMDAAQARELIAFHARSHLGCEPDWLEDGIEIPMMMRRAPVKPSTSD